MEELRNERYEEMFEEVMLSDEFKTFFKYQELLHVGDVFNNYKHLCRHLGEDERVSQNSRNSHYTDWKEYFTYEKHGHKFKIIEIATLGEREREDGREDNANVYGKQLDLVIMNILVRCGDSFLCKTRDDWTEILGMHNYLLNRINEEGNFEKHEYSKEKAISIEEIDEFLDATKKRTDTAFMRALERLSKKKLLSWEDVLEAKVEVLSRSEEKTYYYETFYEDKYKPIRREVLTKFKCKDEQQVYAIGAYNPKFLQDYRGALHNRLYEELGIVSSYKAVEVTFNKKEMEKYIDMFIKDEELLGEISKLNKLLVGNFLETLEKYSDDSFEMKKIRPVTTIKHGNYKNPEYEMIEDEEEVDVVVIGNKVKVGTIETYFDNQHRMTKHFMELRDVDNRQRKSSFRKIDEEQGFDYFNEGKTTNTDSNEVE